MIKFSKKIKRKMAYILLTLSLFVVIFNNAGQFLTFVDIPFSSNAQMYTGIIGAILSFMWYAYLQRSVR